MPRDQYVACIIYAMLESILIIMKNDMKLELVYSESQIMSKLNE